MDAIKKYVENGGHALFMLDPPVKLGRDEDRQNAALAKVLAKLGRDLNKDLVLDTSGIGQIFGFGPKSSAGHAVRIAAHRARDEAKSPRPFLWPARWT